MTTLSADQVVIGSGAMGMAFTDTLLAETAQRVIAVAPAAIETLQRLLACEPQ